MALVYPLHTGFDPDLPVFVFDSRLSLWLLPLDPEQGKLVVPWGW